MTLRTRTLTGDSTLHAAPTLLAALWPSERGGMLRGTALAIAGTLLLTLSAKVQVPFWPVPITMQTFVVLALGAAFGMRLATATMLLYLAEGLIGLPVFAGTPEKGLGLAYMMGPTGGYLIGFVLAAALVGWLAERGWDRSIPHLFAAMLAGHAVIFACGFGWLASLIGTEKAWMLGVVPFFAATLFKTALGAVVLPAGWSLLKR